MPTPFSTGDGVGPFHLGDDTDSFRLRGTVVWSKGLWERDCCDSCVESAWTSFENEQKQTATSAFLLIVISAAVAYHAAVGIVGGERAD